MKFTILYMTAFMLVILSFLLILQSRPSPEAIISGEWAEVSWKYEKINATDNLDFKNYDSEQVKNLLGKDLVIYEAEKWEFLPDGKLKLIGGETIRIADWRIKGRGHILQIRYLDGLQENYNIFHLKHRKMVLNFDADAKVRGIGQLTFTRI
ncbi:hypothetical protein QQ020_14355 [Fulvivirgaceae bacterium BMA12]|uniref:Lipocalin-like domain-containing protein n=1 Tax=Agaribacillus aureus TaxID=3051825 RepID=A0ABT8L672_9BACT|nr:hypothetical protein [Fulvivirgaceae bacterium BMA12]